MPIILPRLLKLPHKRPLAQYVDKVVLLIPEYKRQGQSKSSHLKLRQLASLSKMRLPLKGTEGTEGTTGGASRTGWYVMTFQTTFPLLHQSTFYPFSGHTPRRRAGHNILCHCRFKRTGNLSRTIHPARRAGGKRSATGLNNTAAQRRSKRYSVIN
jgi:hypothetical protein